MDRLTDFLFDQKNSRLIKCLAILDFAGGGPMKVSEIEKTAVAAGVRDIGSWNVSQIFKRSGGAAALLPEGWKLSQAGRSALSGAEWKGQPAHVTHLIEDLNSALAKIKNDDRRAFLREAVNCYAAEHFRASVVLSWSGAIAVMHDHVIAHRLADFNQEAKRQGVIKKDLNSASDLQDIKDYTFLQLINAIGMIDKNQKQELDGRRQFRNACGHPSSLNLRGRMVAAHLESLILNVFDKY